MALVITDCRSWQCHHQPQLFPLDGWSKCRLWRIPKRTVFSYNGERQQGKVILKRSNESGVSRTGLLQRNSLLSFQSKLNAFNQLSEFISSSETRDGGPAGDQRPPFDLDLAVLLAGFAFESYNTPAKDAGVVETDGDCETVFLSRALIKSIYDGILFVNLKKGIHFPGLDLWGTSDPYVMFRIGGSSVRSRTIWANKDPVWNENLTLNVKTSAGQNLQVVRTPEATYELTYLWQCFASIIFTVEEQGTILGQKLRDSAWDANIVTTPRRIGNTSVSLESLCDGQRHSLELNLEGMGGGGTLFLEVHFKSFEQIEAEKNQFSIGGLFSGELLANAYRSIFGESGISVGDFLDDLTKLETGFDLSKPASATLDNSENAEPSVKEDSQLPQIKDKGPSRKNIAEKKGASDKPPPDGAKEVEKEGEDGEVEMWQNLVASFSEALKPFGLDMSEILKDREDWGVDQDVKSVGLESQKRAEFLYAENGLAVVEDAIQDTTTSSTLETNGGVSGNYSDSSPSGKDLLESLVKQTEGVVGAWAILNKSYGENQSGGGQEQAPTELEPVTAAITRAITTSTEDEKADGPSKKQEDEDIEAGKVKKTMFSTAESAMEAWALLATTLGGTCFVKSDFEKITFVENRETDTQVVIWRDLRRQRLVVAFRGTEQTKWKDVVTDISLLTTGFNPERVAGGNNLEEPLVHSGFLKAYDSVKSRILSLVRASIDTSIETFGGCHWHVYVTGHSLGGALATLFALELSSNKLAKSHNLEITMYNYGSPRVGNRLFADNYNQIVKDSWRVVNHRDIVPTVPRLMGYCHVAQPIYLTADESPMSELLDDGYHGDVLGEATPDIIIDKFMKGEQALLQKLLDTEIAMLRAMRDGSAVMQHMEDFYYITLLQRVESRIR